MTVTASPDLAKSQCSVRLNASLSVIGWARPRSVSEARSVAIAILVGIRIQVTDLEQLRREMNDSDAIDGICNRPPRLCLLTASLHL